MSKCNQIFSLMEGIWARTYQWIKKRDVHAKDLVAAFYKCYPLKPK